MTLQAIFQLGVYNEDTDKQVVFTPTFECNLTGFRMVTRRESNSSRPTTQPKTEILEVTLAYKERSFYLFDWYVKNTRQCGRIVAEAMLPGSLEPLKRSILFFDAQCFSMNNEFHQDPPVRKYRLQIAVSKIVVDEEEFTRN